MDAARAEKPFIGGGSRPFAAFWRQKDEAAAGSQKPAFGVPPQPRGPGRRPGRASRPPIKGFSARAVHFCARLRAK